jgi:phosphoadenosine phosphosulfate reductase
MAFFDLQTMNQKFANSSPQEILVWTIDTFWPDVVMSSSFQTQSIPLLHMIAEIKPDLPIYFLDTGHHFPETLHYKAKLQETWKLNIIDLRQDGKDETDAGQCGEPLHRTDPDKCCRINKVAPMEKALQNTRAWITGIRREQTEERPKANILELRRNGLFKINPLLNWTRQELWQYIHDYNLPLHPLFSKGYLSIGCAPCTRPVQPGENERAGRWADTNKAECGLHTVLLQQNE